MKKDAYKINAHYDECGDSDLPCGHRVDKQRNYRTSIHDVGRDWRWQHVPIEVQRCRAEDHITSDYDLKPGKVVRKMCLDCRIVWEEKVIKKETPNESANA